MGKYSHHLFLAILCSLSPNIPMPCFHFSIKEISRNNNKNNHKTKLLFSGQCLLNAKLSFEHILHQGTWRFLHFSLARSKIKVQKIQMKYFKCHSIQNYGSTKKVYKFLGSLRDAIQIRYFYRGLIILHSLPPR